MIRAELSMGWVDLQVVLGWVESTQSKLTAFLWELHVH